jgi:hypothetical protein
MVWGGKLHTKTEIFQFESVSLIINIIIIVFLNKLIDSLLNFIVSSILKKNPAQ